MVSFETLRQRLIDTSAAVVEYETTRPLNLYDSADCKALATQARMGLHLKIQHWPDLSLDAITALPVILCEDDYPGWIALEDLHLLQPVAAYRPPTPSLTEIQTQIPQAIAFAQAAMMQPNTYLWGGTVGPNYDCSGLVQHAFSVQGVWLPRDAYQQESFVNALVNPGDRPEHLIDILNPGDLIFFGTPAKTTHVAIYLEKGAYIHSSGQDQGRNGIGIDILSDPKEAVSRHYYAQVRGAGRVVHSYQPGSKPWLETSPGGNES